jgi:hypothetical protein
VNAQSPFDRCLILVASNSRDVRKFVRGYHAELTDSELTDAMDATVQPPAVILPDGSAFQRPRVSLDGTLALWCVWKDHISPRALLQLYNAVEYFRALAGGVLANAKLRAYSESEDWRGLTGWTEPAGGP